MVTIEGTGGMGLMDEDEELTIEVRAWLALHHYLKTMNDVIPAGEVVVHNRVRPSIRLRLGSRGFRAWHQKLDDPPELVACDCGWAPKFGTHYRVAGID